MNIKDTELLTRDEYVENLDRLVREQDYLKKRKPTLVHQYDFVSEACWEDKI